MESSESDNDSSTPTCFIDVNLPEDDDMDSDYYEEVKDPQAAADEGDALSQPHNSQVGNNFLPQRRLWPHILISQSSFISVNKFQL